LVHLSNQENKLIWSFKSKGSYSQKLGYEALIEKENLIPPCMGKLIWKLNCLAKTKLFTWILLKGKVPTWEDLQKRSFTGPNICPLYKQQEETSLHIFLSWTW
jgi:hypothetical protein